MRRKFFGSARALPSRKNYSPLATRCRFGSAGASPSRFIHATELGATKTKPAEAG